MTPLPTHKAFALGLFRSSVFFIFAIMAFSERDQKTQTILISIVFLADVVSWHLCQVIFITGESVYNRVWMNTLQDRLFIDGVIEDLRAGYGVNVARQRENSFKQTRDDVGKFFEETTLWYKWGGFRKTLLGLMHFGWYWTSYGIFYGLAAFLANSAH